MPRTLTILALLAVTLSTTWAQDNGGTVGGDGSSGNVSPASVHSTRSTGAFNFATFPLTKYQTVATVHAVLATTAFGFFFPVGAILVRVANFPGVWLVHAIIQAFAYMSFIAAAGLGIWMTTQLPPTSHVITHPHPLIGLTLLGLLFFQPILGLLHHIFFRKHSRRTIWSHAHIWLGRIVLTLGIINGGLGLKLGTKIPFLKPSRRAVVGYGVGAGLMWVLYVLAVVYGEMKKKRRAGGEMGRDHHEGGLQRGKGSGESEREGVRLRDVSDDVERRGSMDGSGEEEREVKKERETMQYA